MTEEYFYHYTSEDAAKDICLEGKILPSFLGSGDAAYGNGVYLTTLEPRLGKETVKKNNWNGSDRGINKKVDAYFEILMSSSNVRRVKDKRDIQVPNGVLKLADYKWSLLIGMGS